MGAHLLCRLDEHFPRPVLPPRCHIVLNMYRSVSVCTKILSNLYYSGLDGGLGTPCLVWGRTSFADWTITSRTLVITIVYTRSPKFAPGRFSLYQGLIKVVPECCRQHVGHTLFDVGLHLLGRLDEHFSRPVLSPCRQIFLNLYRDTSVYTEV